MMVLFVIFITKPNNANSFPKDKKKHQTSSLWWFKEPGMCQAENHRQVLMATPQVHNTDMLAKAVVSWLYTMKGRWGWFGNVSWWAGSVRESKGIWWTGGEWQVWKACGRWEVAGDRDKEADWVKYRLDTVIRNLCAIILCVRPGCPWKMCVSMCIIVVAAWAVNTVLFDSAPIMIVAVERRRGRERREDEDEVNERRERERREVAKDRGNNKNKSTSCQERRKVKVEAQPSENWFLTLAEWPSDHFLYMFRVYSWWKFLF